MQSSGAISTTSVAWWGVTWSRMITPLATTFKVWSRETATSFAYVPATNTASGVQQPPLHPERLLPVSFNHRKQSIPTFSVPGTRVVESGWYYYRRYKKLSRGTARRAMSVEILPAAAQLYEISPLKTLTITPFTRYNRLSNWLYNRFDNRVERTDCSFNTVVKRLYNPV